MNVKYNFGFLKSTKQHNEICSDNQFICNYLLRKSIQDFSAFLQGPVLDVGCGSRPYDEYFSALQKYSCDLDPKRGVLDVICMATPLPFTENCFASVLCTEVLEHVPDPHKVIKDFYRILKPKGRILISVPNWWPPHELPYDFFRYPERGFRFLLESNGFCIMRFFPRGGLYALLGQIIILMMPQYFPFRWQRSFWNIFFLKLDSWRKNYAVSLGWKCLAEKLDKEGGGGSLIRQHGQIL